MGPLKFFSDTSPTNILPSITPVQSGTVAYGGQHVFELDKRGDLLKGLALNVTRAAFSGGNTGTTTAFNDFEGYSTIDNVRFFYSNKMFHVCYGEELYRKYLQRLTEEQRTGVAALQFGNKTDAQRVANTAATQWTVDLMVPWDKLKKSIPMLAMPNKIRVEVNYKSLAACMRDSASVTCSITAAKLRCDYVHLLHDNRKIKYNQVHSESIFHTHSLQCKLTYYH